MADSPHDKTRPPQKPEPTEGSKPMEERGRIVHDERGNAIWNWVKETGRVCIDSTSAMLKKLDFGDLKIEGEGDGGLKLEDKGRDAGGGYDPYNGRVSSNKREATSLKPIPRQPEKLPPKSSGGPPPKPPGKK